MEKKELYKPFDVCMLVCFSLTLAARNYRAQFAHPPPNTRTLGTNENNSTP